MKCYKSLLIGVLLKLFVNKDNEDVVCRDGGRLFQRDGPLYFS